MRPLTVPEVAAWSGLPPVSVRYHCRLGVLAGVVEFTASQWLIPADVASAFIIAARLNRAAGTNLRAATFTHPPCSDCGGGCDWVDDAYQCPDCGAEFSERAGDGK